MAVLTQYCGQAEPSEKPKGHQFFIAKGCGSLCRISRGFTIKMTLEIVRLETPKSGCQLRIQMQKKLNMNSCSAIAWQWIFHLTDAITVPTDVTVQNFPDAIGLFAVLASLGAD